jgi:phage terminase large subunit
MTQEVTIATTPVFWANKKAYDSGNYRLIGNQGSTRSSKTYSICQLLVDIASGGINQLTGKPYGKKQISIVSPSLPHMKKGARKDTLKILEDLQIFSENDFNRTDQLYKFPNTGSYIEFFGADDSGKVRGPGRDILYINEANLLDRSIYRQLALRTKETIFIDFNPADEYNYVYELVDDPKNKLIISTYRNNKANLDPAQIAEIESYKDADENFWKVYGLGQRGTSSETIYTHWKMCEELPGKGEVIYGQDFGFNNPSALVKVEIYEGAAYVDEILYQSKLTTNDLIELYKDLKITRDPIYCDSAEPKTIEEITRAGFNALPSIKDVYVGIQKVKSMPLYITQRSVNILKEVKSYKWKKDKNDKVEDDPVKLHDHSMDAMRYAINTHLAIPETQWWTA